MPTAPRSPACSSLRDLVVGLGEIWSTRIFSTYLADRCRQRGGVRWVDARDLIVLEWGPLGPTVRWPDSSTNLARLNPEPEETLIVTGFDARDAHRRQTTPGRNGSGFTSSIVGNCSTTRFTSGPT